ncbi:hypothetical protein, partial [Salmonella enterica]|uniref:hypothetical protein n=1 Tax=Salmonella enterica TaxID=28901 RepID=UPI002634F470
PPEFLRNMALNSKPRSIPTPRRAMKLNPGVQQAQQRRPARISAQYGAEQQTTVDPDAAPSHEIKPRSTAG